jgi:membrane protein implicated in regulation of membrane protease activity
MIRDWLALVGFLSLSALTTWAVARLCRNGGATGTPHWNAATAGCAHSVVETEAGLVCVHCGRVA